MAHLESAAHPAGSNRPCGCSLGSAFVSPYLPEGQHRPASPSLSFLLPALSHCLWLSLLRGHHPLLLYVYGPRHYVLVHSPLTLSLGPSLCLLVSLLSFPVFVSLPAPLSPRFSVISLRGRGYSPGTTHGVVWGKFSAQISWVSGPIQLPAPSTPYLLGSVSSQPLLCLPREGASTSSFPQELKRVSSLAGDRPVGWVGPSWSLMDAWKHVDTLVPAAGGCLLVLLGLRVELPRCLVFLRLP